MNISEYILLGFAGLLSVFMLCSLLFLSLGWWEEIWYKEQQALADYEKEYAYQEYLKENE